MGLGEQKGYTLLKNDKLCFRTACTPRHSGPQKWTTRNRARRKAAEVTGLAAAAAAAAVEAATAVEATATAAAAAAEEG